MTCFTSQFFEPADSGTVLDERAFVHPDVGAAAVWGPAGLSVATGHDDLQYGFHRALWRIKEEGDGKASWASLSKRVIWRILHLIPKIAVSIAMVMGLVILANARCAAMTSAAPSC